MNAIKKLVAGSIVVLAASVWADTYYWIGQTPNNATGYSRFVDTKKGETYGWSLNPAATTTPAAHTVSAGNDYVIQAYDKSYPRVPVCTFEGDTVKLIGTLPLCNNGTATFKKIIAQPYESFTSSTISLWVDGTATVNADVEIAEGCALGFRNANTAKRSIVLGTSENKITGSGSIKLSGSGMTGGGYEILSDASGFTGTIDVGWSDASKTRAAGPVYFKLSCSAFGGTVTDIPNSTQVVVNYDGLPSDKGLRVATTTVPVALKTKLHFWSSTADFTAKNFPLMTFPAGTGISTDDFKVYHRTTKDGDGTAFADLGVQVNTDGSMTLVANFEGQTVNLNSWTTEPALSKAIWMVREDEPGAVTRTPVAKYGVETMTVTLNGQPWDGTMPTAIGSYTIAWSVAATESYTGISISSEFTITEFVDPVNSPIRYLPAGGQYWKPATALFSAIDALPQDGGIIELNADLMDSQPPGASDFTKPIIFRSSTHPDRAGQRFTFSYTSNKRVRDSGSLCVSNLIVGVLGSNCDIGFSVDGNRCLTIEKDVEFLNMCTIVNASGGNAKVDFNGVVITNVANSTSSHLCNLSSGASLTIQPGTLIAGVRRASIIKSDATSTVTLLGGVITNNVITGAAGAAIIAGGVVNVSGSPVVWNNTRTTDGAQANICPTDESKIRLTGDLGVDAKLGVSYGSAAGDSFGVCATGNPGKAFVCDANEKLCGVAKSDGFLHWKSRLPGLIVIFE